MIFKNRLHAAQLLAEKLQKYRGTHPLVLGVPRGAVPMAKLVARELDGDLDVVLVRKLRAPGQPELAIGSIDEDGHLYLNVYGASAPPQYLEAEKAHQLALLAERRRLYSTARTRIDPKGRTVIIVDDGLATGSSMIAAVRALKREKAARVIVAVGAAPTETVELLRHEADEVVAVTVSDMFGAVGAFFEEFPQVSDEEVVAALKTPEPIPAA
jgi:predicted phosphoribosyltransferase